MQVRMGQQLGEASRVLHAADRGTHLTDLSLFHVALNQTASGSRFPAPESQEITCDGRMENTAL